MKVCFFNTNLAWGGGERWHSDMAMCLHEKKYEVTVVVHPNGSLFSVCRKNSINPVSVKLHNLSFLNPVKITRLFFLFKKLKPDVLILNLPRDAKAAGLAAKMAGIKNIVYRRGSAIPIKNKPINRFLFKNVISTIIANSEETKNTILKNNPALFDRDKIHVIYNGIDIAPFEKQTPGSNNEEFVIGNLGRLVEQKGQKYLIELAKILKEEKLPFKIIIGGDGVLENELKALAQEKQVDDCIDFIGFVDDIPSFMNQVDVFVLPSLWEGFGYVLAEAMAAKKPLVAFNVSSNPELVSDGENGFLVEMGNVKELAEKIIMLYKSPEIMNKLGERGRQIVEEKFTEEKTLDKLEKLLLELLPGG